MREWVLEATTELEAVEAVLFELASVTLLVRAKLKQIVFSIDILGARAALAGEIALSQALGEFIPKGVVVVVENVFIE